MNLKQIAATLQHQTEILQSVLDSIGEGVIVSDENGKFLLFNPAAEKILGLGATELPPEEWPGQYGIFITDTTTPYPAQELPLTKAIRGEETNKVEMFIRNPKLPEGAFLSVTGRPLTDEQGVLKGGVVVFHDITERRRAEEALRQSETAFRSLAQSATDAIISANSSGNIIFWNRGAQTIFGYTEKEVLGKPLSLLMPERHRDAHKRGMSRFQRTGVSHVIGETVEMHALKKDGFEFPMELSLASWQTKEGEFFSGIIRDITERKRAQEQLKQTAEELARSNRELEQFASVASHDLQEPLRVMTSYLQLLQRRFQEKLDAEGNKFIARSVDAAARMKTLVNDLLNYSRVSTRGEPFKSANCQDILHEVRDSLRVAIDESGATLTYDTLPEVMADHTQLTQLFQNLIGNAIKFRGEVSPKIHVTAEHKDAAWLFSVRDNGIGIEPQYAERIFDIFQRLHSRRDYPGTGVGLAICRKIVERHGGQIWMESALGHGTTFNFTLPDRGGGQDDV
jgi:PAS domain S-box-containing protein